MAQKPNDSDDSDEYEVMVTPTLSPLAAAELTVREATTASEILQIPRNLTPVSENDKRAKKVKKKGIFRRMSKSKGKPVKKSNTFHETSSEISKRYQQQSQPQPAVTVATAVPTKSKAGIAGKNRSASSLQPSTQQEQLPTIGPKPPRRLSEEEHVRKIRKQQKEMVALARQQRAQDSGKQHQHQRSHSTDYEPDYVVDRSYGEIETVDIVNKYSEHLPMEVVVSKGIYGMEEKYSLATSDRCVIHFLKKRELVQIQDPTNNNEFSVPLNSAIKFAVVYNPDNDDRKAMVGHTFQYVSDLLAQTKLPKFGLAHLKDPDINMKSIEILVVEKIIFPDNPIHPRKLKVYSLTAKCHRELPETQEFNFRTTPSSLQLYLPELFKYIPDPCPLHIAMYRNPLARPLIAPGIPSSMFRRVLYLKKHFTDILLIATGCSGGDDTSGSQDEPFEIPTDIDVEFEVVKQSKEGREKMLRESKQLKEKLKDKEIRHHRYVGVTDEQHRMQLSLYKSTLEGPVPGTDSRSEDGEDGADGDYVKATSGNRLAMNHRVELLEENMKRCSHSLAEAKATLAVLTQENAKLTDKVQNLEETVSTQKAQLNMVDSIGREMSGVFTELEQLRNEVRTLLGGKTPPPVSRRKSQTPPHSTSPSIGRKETPPHGTPPSVARKEAPLHGTPPSVARKEAPPHAMPPIGHKSEAPPHTTGRMSETPPHTPPTSRPEEEDSQVHEGNKQILSQMTKTEVSRMLQRAGLGLYGAMVEAENIGGDILVECNEEILEKEMGIKSRLHRLKLMKIIEGKAGLDLYRLVD